MKLAWTLLLVVHFSCSFAQGFRYPPIQQEGSIISDFVPKGWRILKSAAGDLNRDNKQDFAFVIQHIDSVTIVTPDGEYLDTVITQPRMLLVAFAHPTTNMLNLIEPNTTFIPNHENANQDDPFESITIKKGILQINVHLFFSAGTWYVTDTSYKFRYQDKDFALIGADYRSFHRASGDIEAASFNFLTKRWSWSEFNDNSGRKPVTKWKVLSLPQLKTFKTFKKPFSWEVSKNIYI